LSRRADESFAKVIQTNLRGFLRSGVTGCAFASAHAKEAGAAVVYDVFVGPLDGDLPTDIEVFFDSAAAERAAAVVVLPELRTASEICELIRLLSGHPRWKLARPAWKRHPREDLLVGLRWTTTAGDVTSVMGLAPPSSRGPAAVRTRTSRKARRARSDS
jgi:hypothetical protein